MIKRNITQGRGKMSKKYKKNKKYKSINKEMESLSNEALINIHTEAYYRALKKVKENNIKELNEKEQMQYKPIQKLLIMLNVIFCPWRLSKKFILNGQIYDGFLVVAVSGIMEVSGVFVWMLGGLGAAWIVLCEIMTKGELEGYKIIVTVIIIILLFMIGSLLYISGKSFEKEKDSNRIYAYSASIFALISCVISIVSIIIKR